MENLNLFFYTVHATNSHTASGLQNFSGKDVSSSHGCINRVLPSKLRWNFILSQSQSKGLQMKKIVAALTTLAAAQFCFAADSAGLVGIVNTSGTVEVNNFLLPRDVWTLYFANDPSESAVVLAYVAYRKLGQHQASIEWADQKGNPLDKCAFDPSTVTKLPYIQTLTCKWGGRLPDGGLTFSVYDRFEGKKEKVGEMFLPSKMKQ